MTSEISEQFERLARERGSILMERGSEYRHAAAVCPGEPVPAAQRPVEALFADFYERGHEEGLSEQDMELLHRGAELLRCGADERGAEQAAAECLLAALLDEEGQA